MNVKTIKELIRYQKELALMNGVQLTSWEALGYGISSTTKKMLKWLVTNPAGWAILATTAITGLVKGYDALIGRQEKLARTKIEDLDEDISKYDEEIRSLEELQSKLESAKGNKSELAQIQNELNDAIGETTGLLNGEGKAYDIANAKLKANIELKKQQREQAQKDRIKEKKNLFDDNVYEDGNSWFNTNADSMRWYAQKYQELIKEYENALDDSDIKKMYGSAEDYAFGWLNVNAGAGIKESTWADYWDEQVQTAYDIFEDTIEDYDGVGGQDFIKNIINNMVRGGSDLSQISDVIFDIINNQDLQDKINEYWASLVDPEIDSEKALNAVKTMIDGIIKQYPQLEAFFTDFYDGIVGGANVVADTVTDTANKIDVSLDSYKKASEGISSLSTAFKELTDSEYVSLDTISKIKEAVGDSVSNWDEYEQKLLSVEKGTAEYNQLMRELTYATLEKQLGGVNALANANEKYVAQLLKENGVLNANEVAHSAVERAKAKEWVQAQDNNDISEDTIASLIQEANAAGISTNAYLELTAKEILFNNNELDTSQKCQQILAIANAAGIASTAYSTLTNQINEWKSAKLGSGTRTKTATDLGMTVINEKNRGKDGKGKGNLYVASDGKQFEDYEDAMYYQESLNNVSRISNAYSNTNFVLPDYSGVKTSTSKDTKETFDWIETKISRLQRSITNFGKTVSATWKSWTDRNSALKSQISAVTSEINLQQQAADKYLSLANGVSLSGTYKELVRNGSLNISTITDENTIDAIKKYKEYYENYLSALDAKQDAEDELRNLKQTSADNISTEYDDLVSFIEHEKSMLDSTANILESKGYMASASIYDKLIQYEYDTISKLEEKYKKLNENLNNSGIQQGTEQWNDMKLEILEVEEVILESKNALAEYNNTLQELDWEVFDKLQEKISGITEEADFLIKLMSDEKMFDEGKITEHGQATLGLYVLNYKTYLAQAEEYGQKLEEIREDLKNDPYNQTLIDQEKEWAEALRDSILASEDALQSIVDLKQEGYDSLLESLDTAIEKYKDLINEQKNAYDYQKQIDNLTGDVAKYQKITKSLEGMKDTEEGKKLIQEYSVKLKESEEALAEAENEKYLDDLDKLLQNLSDDATEFVSQKMDNVDALVKEVIAQTETNTGSILETLKTETSNVGTSITQEMESIWGTNGTFTTSLNSVVDMLKQYFDDLQKESDTKASEIIASTPSGGASSGSTTPTTSTHAPSTGSSGSSSSSGWGSWFVSKTYAKQNLNPETSIVDRLKSKNINADFSYRSQYYRAMGGSGIYTGSASQNRWMLAQMKSHGFAQGGTIGNLIKATGEDGFVLARKGEGILTPENMKMLENVMITMNPIVDSLAKLPSLPDMRKQNGDMQVTFGDIQMYGVNDPVEFEKQLLHHMKNSHPIRKVMKDTTIGEALGKNPMIRYTR